jgi:menaquinone-dependent protoporphyrinogen oxidase
MNVLVAVASRYGSTRGIGKAIADKLRVAGYAVDLRDAGEAVIVESYDAVVLGSAIYNQAWIVGATEFARRERAALAERPAWLFSVGAISSDQDWPLGAIARQEPKEIAILLAATRPRDYHVFAGAVAPEHLSFVGRLFFKVLKGRYGDYRDWREIGAWAEHIARELAGGAAAPAGLAPATVPGAG